MLLTAATALASATLLTVAWTLDPTVKNLCLLFGALFLEISVLLAGRYLLRDYFYALFDSDGSVDFVVVEQKGKKRSVVCRIAVSDVRTLVASKKERDAFAEGESMRNYDYCMDIGAKGAKYLCLIEDGKRVSVKFTPSERMTELLNALIHPSEVNGEASDGEVTQE
ncbi:MAG: hypothetical protein J6B77_01395 [Clostridia bacterium]|nr:hypothetical protein [Clostridia bacterium]